MQRNSTAFVWALFLGLGFFWGSSYFWIKVALETVPPLTMIGGRLVLASIFLWAVVLLIRDPLPRSARQYGHLMVMALVNIVVPFILIAFGEQSIDSALASILNATVPLFVIVMAPLFLPDEGITWPRVAGLAVGFAGVILLVAPDLVNMNDNDLTGELLLLGSSLSYAIGNIYAKRNVKGLAPRIPALFQVFLAMLVIVPAALIIDRPFATVQPAPEAIIAIVWLGIIGSGLAYICYFTILANWGATRTSLVAYLLPVVGILLGSAILGDPLTLNRIAGTALVIAGIALVNSGPAFRRFAASRAARTTPASERS
jgi:drug/metabolite transporter (DMT)-like permease